MVARSLSKDWMNSRKPLSDVDSVYDMLINDESPVEIHTPTPSFNFGSAAFSTRIKKSYYQKVKFEQNKKSPLV